MSLVKTINGTPTIVIKGALQVFMLALQKIYNLVESYEKGEITEEDLLRKVERTGEFIENDVNVKLLEKQNT